MLEEVQGVLSIWKEAHLLFHSIQVGNMVQKFNMKFNNTDKYGEKSNYSGNSYVIIMRNYLNVSR